MSIRPFVPLLLAVLVCAGCSDDAPTSSLSADNIADASGEPDAATPIEDVPEAEPDTNTVDTPSPEPSPDAAVPDAAVPDAQMPDAEQEVGPEPGLDSDGDGVPNDEDAFPFDPTETTDSDMDGVGDNSDQFPNDPDESADFDMDGVGNNADEDDDNDGLTDIEELESGEDCLRSNPFSADTDDDDIADADDPYPRDPFPEFLLRANDRGTIDLFLSNRDGTFEEAVEIGEPIFNNQDQALNYSHFSIGDFNNDGKMDFVAHSTPLIEGEPTRHFYFFFRDEKADEFMQVYIGDTDILLAGTLTDANRDDRFDLVTFTTVRMGNITSGSFQVFLGNYNGVSTCVHSEHPEDNCFFIRKSAQGVDAQVRGQWKALRARQAVNLNPLEDDHSDLTLVTYASGGNAPTTVYSLFSNGDGTFDAPVEGFVHNQNRTQAPANTVLFADFNGDNIGDVLLGFDDDGRPGESWTYFGDGRGAFESTPVMALDINPDDARESPSRREFLGRESSGRTFDFDFDGKFDLVIGVRHVAYTSPGQTRLYKGVGNGTFETNFTVIGPETLFSGQFELPQRLCPTFDFGD